MLLALNEANEFIASNPEKTAEIAYKDLKTPKENALKDLANYEYELRFSQDDFNYLLDSFGANTANAIQKTFDKYKKCYLDITEDQFLKDSEGNIYCVDALMDIDLYEEIQNS